MPEEETVPVKRPRAPRKRGAVSSAEPKPRAPRRTVDQKTTTPRRKTVIEATESVAPEPLKRKAPTLIAAKESDKKTRRKQLIVASVVMICGIGASAAFGFSDAGKIDVNKTIETRNERITSSGDTASGKVIVPVQNTSGEPNGGMRGRGVGTQNNPPPEIVASSTATTTAETASSAQAATEEVIAESTELGEATE